MQISAALAGTAGVERALVAMATELNLDLLPDLGIERPTAASPNDLLVAVVARDGQSLATALDMLERELTGASPPPPSGEAAVSPRTTATAARSVAGPALALVSTPGRYAFVEAMDALDAGLSVMVFSDNVPIDQEVRLKRAASERDLLVMGPDCGTAVVGGVGLGFANVVRPGPVGLVAASGTGAQHVMSLLAAGGVGVSHCLGVGGRDLSEVVGGRSTRAALAVLDGDRSTELIVVLGKPPAPSVAAELAAYASTLDTPVVFAPLGPDRPDLTAVAADVLTRLGAEVPDWPSWTPLHPTPRAPGRYLRGLFSGGTLCVEAQIIAAAKLGPVRSNVPVQPDATVEGGHLLLDLGADEYTVGRPHPMIDLGPRLALIAAAAADPDVGVVLLDVVLGHGAHPDPAGDLAPAIAAALSGAPDRLAVVVSLVGTPDDPQGLTRQAGLLCDAGASVYLSNAEATRRAVEAVR